MTITLAPSAPPQVDSPQTLLLRAQHDFDEMPTLRLTAAQAMRLWDLDRATCSAVLGTLVEAHLVYRDSQGHYARVQS